MKRILKSRKNIRKYQAGGTVGMPEQPMGMPMMNVPAMQPMPQQQMMPAQQEPMEVAPVMQRSSGNYNVVFNSDGTMILDDGNELSLFMDPQQMGVFPDDIEAMSERELRDLIFRLNDIIKVRKENETIIQNEAAQNIIPSIPMQEEAPMEAPIEMQRNSRSMVPPPPAPYRNGGLTRNYFRDIANSIK
jgi:hypothetical protein